MNRHTFLLVTILACTIYPLQLRAQSINVFGAGAYANDCFQAARSASLNLPIDRSSIDKCTLALDHGNLKLKNRAATYVNRGIVYAGLQQYQEALKDYAHAAGLHPDLPAIYVNRGNVYYLTKSFDEAIAEYSKSLAMNTNTAQIAYVNRGMSHEKLGLYAEATADYHKAIELAPDWDTAKKKLAELSARPGP